MATMLDQELRALRDALRGLRELVERNHDEVLRRLEERDGLPPIVEALEEYEVEEDCECNCLACPGCSSTTPTTPIPTPPVPR